jgi:hypothetical protein
VTERNEADGNRADQEQSGLSSRILKEIARLMHARRNTAAGDRLDVLVAPVEAWEAEHEDIADRPWTDHNLGPDLD